MESDNKTAKYEIPSPIKEEEEETVPYFVRLKEFSKYYFQPNFNQKNQERIEK